MFCTLAHLGTVFQGFGSIQLYHSLIMEAVCYWNVGKQFQIPIGYIVYLKHLRYTIHWERLGSLIPACERQVCLANVSVRVIWPSSGTYDTLWLWYPLYISDLTAMYMCFYLYVYADICWCYIGPIWVLVPSGMVHLNHWIEVNWTKI